ncbi:MAG: lysylphosphatidylglycerol synthase transmembrane domain-containing protein [Nanoarchaeota archaeon]|nr:lysylphosphatidylglycerol synthase transmembrane domain-containing protein [Nanoarchaeota archaeon]
MINAKKAISIIVLIVTLGLFIYYIYRNFGDFKAMSVVSPLWIIVLGVIFALNLYMNGYLLDTLMRPFGVKLKFKESFGLATLTNFYNMITPFRGGMAARAVYLKKKHDFTYVDFLATLSAIYVVIFLVGSVAGLVSMFAIWRLYGVFNWVIFSLFAGIFVVLLGIVAFSPRFPEGSNKWGRRIVKVVNGWHLIKNNRKIIFVTAVVAGVQLILGTFGNMVAYHVFGIQLEFWKALFISAVSSLSILVAVTPGNLGVGDAISVFSANLVGVGLTEAVAATVLGRAVNLLVIFILGPIFSWVLLREKSEKADNRK